MQDHCRQRRLQKINSQERGFPTQETGNQCRKLMGEVTAAAVDKGVTDVKQDQRQGQISEGFVIRREGFAFNSRKLCRGAREDGGSISIVLNRTLLALWRKSNRMINAGRPERNTYTQVHSKVTRAWSRAQMQGGETMWSGWKREKGGWFAGRVRLVI